MGKYRSILISLIPLSKCFPTTFPALIRRQNSSSIPQYVLDYAPLCWLDENEAYFPSDISVHLAHTTPVVNGTTIPDAPSPLTLDNLSSLNAYGNGGIDVSLTSIEGVAAQPQPSWFLGTKPDPINKSAPGSVIITVAKNSSIVDAFYFFFYSFDQGNFVFGDPDLDMGNHVGDWEHVMIRFEKGKPKSMYFSQHSRGQAFKFSAVQKDQSSGRPINYVAQGTHANYALPGPHDHVIPGVNLPFGALIDHTSKGTMWDPLSQPLMFAYSEDDDKFTPYDAEPTAWLDFTGRWGDQQLPDNDPNQKDLIGFKKYVGGPKGPRSKNLERNKVCQSTSDPCIVNFFLTL